MRQKILCSTNYNIVLFYNKKSIVECQFQTNSKYLISTIELFFKIKIQKKRMNFGRVVPWSSWDEWIAVSQLLYSSNENERISGIEMVFKEKENVHF